MTNVTKRSLLTLIELLPIQNGKRRKGLYQCECGNKTEVFVCNVGRLHTVSCGCIKSGAIRSRNTTHGLRNHPLYRIWADIKTRCTNSNREGSYLYCDRGVRMCDEWLNNPEVFIKWALDNGWQQGMQVDKDKKANATGIPALLYSPELCSVITRKENSNETRRNRKVEFNGEVKNIMQWGEFLGVSKAKFWYRMKACDFDMNKYMQKWNNKK
jgi:hypothetical protein